MACHRKLFVSGCLTEAQETLTLWKGRSKRKALSAHESWGLHFKTPDVYELLTSHDLMSPVGEVAKTRIGLQTLAKDFFVLSPERARQTGIESRFLEPLLQSAHYCKKPVVEESDRPEFYLFCCSDTKHDLQNTKALEHIQRGETAEVGIRGKNTTVTGYQNKERIKRSSRKLWYDLRTDLERRGRAEILIPRLVYRNYTVVWNKARFVPGELFIEFIPFWSIDPEVYLAILNCSVTEILLRAHAQVYGGGTYNISPGRIKAVPIINANRLSEDQRAKLKLAYQCYVRDPNHNRIVLDGAIWDILGLDASTQAKVQNALVDLHLIATSTKKAASRDLL